MSGAADVAPSETPPSAASNDAAARLQALARLVRRGQGRFSIAFVEFDIPRTREQVVSELRTAVADFHVVRVDLAPPPADAPSTYNVLDQLRDLVAAVSPSRTPDALLVGRFERLLPATGDDASRARAIQPLNLGRVVLAADYPYPVIFLLPQGAMALLLQTAPDLRSWQSGYFKFEADLPGVEQEITEAARLMSPIRLRLAFRRRQARLQELDRLQQLLQDADVVEKNPVTLAALRYRLGWLAVHSGQGALARQAFASMLELARVSKDARLIRAAERGRRAASAASRGTALAGVQPFATVGTVGLLLGRSEELQRLVARLDQVDCRFLVLWGRTGVGKSVLVRAGLLPRLKELERYLVIVIDRWHDPMSAIDLAIRGEAKRHQLDLKAGTLHEHVRAISLATGKTVVIVCDQFEQFFASDRPDEADPRNMFVDLPTLSPWLDLFNLMASDAPALWQRSIVARKRHSRREDLEALGNLVGDLSLACKVVLVIRDDALGDVAEFDDFVAEPLELRKRFYLPLLSRPDAERALRQLAEARSVGWSDRFVTAVVDELAIGGRVRPIDIHLVGVALALTGIDNEYDFARAGGVKGLIDDYVDLVLASLYEPGVILRTTRAGGVSLRFQALLTDMPFTESRWLVEPLSSLFQSYERRRWVIVSKQVLLALIDEPARRHALSLVQLVRKTGHPQRLVSAVVERTAGAGIVRFSGGPRRSHAILLAHDELVSLVLRSAQHVQNRQREADRTLRRALEDALATKWRALSLRSWFRVRAHASEELQSTPAAKSLLNRSLTLGLLNAFLITVLSFAVAGGLAVAIQLTRGHLALEFGADDRLVVRRGLPALGFLPFIGDDIVLDTGVVREDIRADRLVPLLQLRHQQLGDHQSGVLLRPELLSSLRDGAQMEIRVALANESERMNAVPELLAVQSQIASTVGSLAASLVVDPAPTVAGIGRAHEAAAKAAAGRNEVLFETSAGTAAYFALPRGLRGDVHAVETVLVDALQQGVGSAAEALIEYARSHPDRPNAVAERLLEVLSTTGSIMDDDARAATAAALALIVPDGSPRAVDVAAATTGPLLAGAVGDVTTSTRRLVRAALEKLARRSHTVAATLGSRLADLATESLMPGYALVPLSRVAPLYAGGTAVLERTLDAAIFDSQSDDEPWLPEVARRLDAPAAERLLAIVLEPLRTPWRPLRGAGRPQVLSSDGELLRPAEPPRPVPNYLAQAEGAAQLVSDAADIAIGQPSLAAGTAARLARLLTPIPQPAPDFDTASNLSAQDAAAIVARAAAWNLARVLETRPDLAAESLDAIEPALVAVAAGRPTEPDAPAAAGLDDDIWLRLASAAAAAGAASSPLVAPAMTIFERNLAAGADSGAEGRSIAVAEADLPPFAQAITGLVKAIPGACLAVESRLVPLLTAAESGRRADVIALLARAAAADPACADRLLPALLGRLSREGSAAHRQQIADGLARAATLRPESVVNAPAFVALLNDSESSVQRAAWQAISAALVALVPQERPEQFLIDHLEGTRTLTASIGADSHTRAAYRSAVSRAMADWLSQGDIENDGSRRSLWFLLVTIARSHPLLHVRMAAFETVGLTATRLAANAAASN